MGLMYGIHCNGCGQTFSAYPSRKGQSGKYPKHCSRACYQKAKAREKETSDWQKDEGIVIRVPAKFFDDHEERECEPFCTPTKRTSRFVWLYWNDEGLDELLDDARHYAEPNQFGEWGRENSSLVRSAASTVTAIEDARAALAEARAKRAGKAVQS